MKHQIQWLALVLVFALGVAGSMGCATMAASNMADRGKKDFYFKPVLSDEIVAIGRPDAALGKSLGQDHVVAFIGLKNTYMLHKGGEELERISQLKLEGRHMKLDAEHSRRLFLKDKQVWGEMLLTYGADKTLTQAEVAELEQGGFTPMPRSNGKVYQKKVAIEGVLYPAIKLSDAQLSKLGTRRPFNLYHSRDEKPPLMGRVLKVPLVAAGVAADIALIPLYAVGVGLAVIIISTN